MYTKFEAVEYIWQHSKYHGNLLGYCEEIARDGNGHVALIFLFNLTEIIFKGRMNDYDSKFIDIINGLKYRNYINKIEYDFLNTGNCSMRKIRNLLAHSNLSRYNIVFTKENSELLYPLTENETCLKLYDCFSDILFNIMLKVISVDFIEPIEIDIDEKIKSITFEIKDIRAEELLKYKGINYKDIDGWSSLMEVEKYRLAENASDVNILSEIFKKLFIKNQDLREDHPGLL